METQKKMLSLEFIENQFFERNYYFISSYCTEKAGQCGDLPHQCSNPIRATCTDSRPAELSASPSRRAQRHGEQN